MFWSTGNMKVGIVQINHHKPILWLQGNMNKLVFFKKIRKWKGPINSSEMQNNMNSYIHFVS